MVLCDHFLNGFEACGVMLRPSASLVGLGGVWEVGESGVQFRLHSARSVHREITLKYLL